MNKTIEFDTSNGSIKIGPKTNGGKNTIAITVNTILVGGDGETLFVSAEEAREIAKTIEEVAARS